MISSTHSIRLRGLLFSLSGHLEGAQITATLLRATQATDITQRSWRALGKEDQLLGGNSGCQAGMVGESYTISGSDSVREKAQGGGLE